MSLPIELSLPDPNTYTIVINEYQRTVLMNAMKHYASLPRAPRGEQEGEMARNLADMLDMEGSTGPLAVSPAVNGFVL